MSAISSAWESDRIAIATLARQVEVLLTELQPVAAGEWRGPASVAFEHALVTLRQEVSGAAELLRAAERFTAAAIAEG